MPRSINELFHKASGQATQAWQTNTLSYFYAATDTLSAGYTAVRALTTAERALFELALREYASIANLTFAPTTSDGPATIAVAAGNGSGSLGAYPDPTNTAGGNIMYDIGQLQSYPSFVILHELGHALGLTHPFEQTSTYYNTATERDVLFSVMDYPQLNPSRDRSGIFTTLQHLSLYDVAQIQTFYGPNTTWHAGATTYTFTGGSDSISAGTDPFDFALSQARCVWDANGLDTFDLSSAPGATDSDGVLVNLGQGQFSAFEKTGTAQNQKWRFTVSVAFDAATSWSPG